MPFRKRLFSNLNVGLRNGNSDMTNYDAKANYKLNSTGGKRWKLFKCVSRWGDAKFDFITTLPRFCAAFCDLQVPRKFNLWRWTKRFLSPTVSSFQDDGGTACRSENNLVGLSKSFYVDELCREYTRWLMGRFSKEPLLRETRKALLAAFCRFWLLSCRITTSIFSQIVWNSVMFQKIISVSRSTAEKTLRFPWNSKSVNPRHDFWNIQQYKFLIDSVTDIGLCTRD